MANTDKNTLTITNLYFDVYCSSRFTIPSNKTTLEIRYDKMFNDKVMNKIRDVKSKVNGKVKQMNFNFFFTVNKDKKYEVSINWADWIFNNVSINMYHEIKGIYIPGHIENINCSKACKKILNTIVKAMINVEGLDYTYDKSNMIMNIKDQRLYDIVENLNITFRLK